MDIDSIDAALEHPITQENTFQNKQESQERKKPGRKRVPTEELKKNYAVQLYFSREEYKKLAQLAYEEAESISSYIKRQMLKMLR